MSTKQKIINELEHENMKKDFDIERLRVINNDLEKDLALKDKTIESLKKALNDNSELYRRAKHDLVVKEQMIENQRKTIEYYAKHVKELKDKLRGLRNVNDNISFDIIDKKDRIEELTGEITKLQERLIEKKFPPLEPDFYGVHATHIRRKYEALRTMGFSHDDAMSLIPMWDDGDKS